jgi:hypothetical protein
MLLPSALPVHADAAQRTVIDISLKRLHGSATAVITSVSLRKVVDYFKLSYV